MALLLAVLFGMMAFAVDIGWIALAKADLHNAADAAALAGAGQLMDGYVQYNLPGQTNKNQILNAAKKAASASAKTFAGYNAAGGVPSLDLRNADVEFGFTDAAGKYTAEPAYQGYPNTVKVTVRLDKSANGPLGLIFGKVFGKHTTDVAVPAAATIYTARIDSFLQPGPILPITYDQNFWNGFLKTGLDPLTGATAKDSQGDPLASIFPNDGFNGEYGLISLNDDYASGSSGLHGNTVPGNARRGRP